MTTTPFAPAAPAPAPDPARHILLRGASWDYYERTLEEIGERHIRVNYYRGDMEIMYPLNEHEGVKKAAARLIELYALERDIPITGLGSVTCRRKEVKAGLEPDECYYVTSRPPPPRARHLDLTKYPPPDLGIEVDVTHSSVPRLPIYAALRVPEVWRFDGERVIALRRQRNGKYRQVERSLAFPDLPMDVFNRFLHPALTVGQHEAVVAFRDGLRG